MYQLTHSKRRLPSFSILRSMVLFGWARGSFRRRAPQTRRRKTEALLTDLERLAGGLERMDWLQSLP